LTKSYSDLSKINTYLGRFEYLKIGGKTGEQTFGTERYLNQILYKSPEWKSFRRNIIIRDLGMDMGFDGFPIDGIILIHHINPITAQDILDRSRIIFDPENVISVSKRTHNAIHYGDSGLLDVDILVERRPNDTCPWRRDV
jgi:hypothetical protein